MPDLFQTAPEEVTRYFRAKSSRPNFDWRDIAPTEHAYAFTVAKSTSHDILADIRDAVDDAIVNRVPFAEFQARLQPTLEEKGWWGRRLVEDPQDGRYKVAQLGSPRRLRTIYWANVRTAHAAGEWERTQRTKAFLPYLVYTLSDAEKKRPEHLGWVGTVLPVDDPWWHTHFPPNGWGCKCGTRQISRREAEERGYDPDNGSPTVDRRPWKNRRTGTTVHVPRGIDPGWDTNPGRTRGQMMSELIATRLDSVPPTAMRAAVADLVASPIFGRFARDAFDTGLRRAEIVRGARGTGRRMSDMELERIAPFALSRYPLDALPARFGAPQPVLVDAATIGHAADHRSMPRAEFWNEIGGALARGRAKRDRNGIIRIFDPATRLFVVIEPGDGHWRVRTAFRARSSRYFDNQAGDEL